MADQLRIVAVRVVNFRSLKCVQVVLNRVTVLIGANNSGKTNFLEAFYAAMGAGRKRLTEADVYVGPGEGMPPKDRECCIDVLVRPCDVEGDVIEAFPPGSFWTQLWGLAISQDDDDNDFIAFRTRLAWNPLADEYVAERHFLSSWPPRVEDWAEARKKERGGTVLPAQLEPLALHLMDAKRDIEDDLRRPGSFLRRLTGDLQIDEAAILGLEKRLLELNQEVVAQSQVLEHLQRNLEELYLLAAGETSEVAVTAVPRRIQDLARSIELLFKTADAQSFSIVRHGMGTRSLASLLVFRAFMSWRTQRSSGDLIHPVLGLEEPEAYLHPQAQQAIFGQIDRIPGQTIISTHSPFIAAQAPLTAVRHFSRVDGGTRVRSVDTTAYGPDELHKLQWMIIKSHGHILFARALLLFEGETENQVLPVLANSFWRYNVHQLGLSLVNVEGSGNFASFVRLALELSIPWYVFTDGEEDVVKKMCRAFEDMGLDFRGDERCFVLPNGHNIETYLVSEGYDREIVDVINTLEDDDEFFDHYVELMHGKRAKKGRIRDYRSAGGRERALVDLLSERKTKYGGALAKAMSELHDPARRCPPAMRRLFEQMTRDLGLDRVITEGP